MQCKIIFLGTGSSVGIPVIGCDCPVCHSENPKNYRLRTSALLEIGDKRLLIDAGPDYREQALRQRIDRLDGVIFTHSHFDHIAGIDELRIYTFRQGKKVPCLVSLETFDELKERYHYLIEPKRERKSICAQLDFQLLDDDFGKCSFLDLEFTYVTYEQVGMKVTGIKIGNLAYLTDIKHYSQEVIDQMKGVDTLVISALKEEDSLAHLSVKQACDFANTLGVRQAFLIHMNHDVDHEKVNTRLPDGIELAYDGLEVPFTVEE